MTEEEFDVSAFRFITSRKVAELVGGHLESLITRLQDEMPEPMDSDWADMYRFFRELCYEIELAPSHPELFKRMQTFTKVVAND